MATGDLRELVDSIDSSEREFEPYAHYGEEEDALKFFFSDAPDYARRLNSRVTIYLSLDTSELVGCQIKSVRHVLDDIGWFDVSIKLGKVRLDMLFLACRGHFMEPEAKKIYRTIGERVSKSALEITVPQST